MMDSFDKLGQLIRTSDDETVSKILDILESEPDANSEPESVQMPSTPEPEVDKENDGRFEDMSFKEAVNAGAPDEVLQFKRTEAWDGFEQARKEERFMKMFGMPRAERQSLEDKLNAQAEELDQQMRIARAKMVSAKTQKEQYAASQQVKDASERYWDLIEQVQNLNRFDSEV